MTLVVTRVVLVVPVLVALGPLTTATATVVEEPPGVWPLEPRPAVVSGFYPPDVRWGSGHRGVDLAGHVGQRVRAALPGTVSFAGRVAGRGVVVVDHGATRTTYEPVATTVRRGEEVVRGEVIGTLGWFGTHCLPAACLHWGLRAGDTYLDPLQLVGGPVPVRLLPLTGAAPLGRVSAATVARRATVPTSSPGPPVRPPTVALTALVGAQLAAGRR